MHDIQQHPDPTTEAGGRVIEAVAVFTSLGEALARARAEQLRRRAAQDHIKAQQIEAQRKQQERQSAEMQRRQEAESRRIYEEDRKIFTQTDNAEWLQRADLLDLAQAWRAAGAHADTDPLAKEAMVKVESQLRDLYPAPMRLYDQRRADGLSPDEAMKPAAAMMAQMPPYTQGRPHGDGHVPVTNRLENRTRRNAAHLAQEGFAVPLKPALASIDINPEPLIDSPRRKHAQSVTTVRSHR